MTSYGKIHSMKHIIKIALGTAILTAVILLLKTPKRETEQQLAEVSDEGYETAHDILYPNQKLQPDKRLHYGPVLPS